jgi:hypothetical protein
VRFPRWRPATWALIVWSAGITIWLVAGLSTRGCQDDDGAISQTVCEIGTGVGVGVILVVGFMGFVVLSLIWLMSRRRRRMCPVCGNDVERGVTVCPACGHDFALAAASPPPPAEEG